MLIDSYDPFNGGNGIGPGQYNNYTSCAKYCESITLDGPYNLCATFESPAGSVSSCASTPITCYSGATYLFSGADAPLGGSDRDPVSTFSGGFYKRFAADLDLGGPLPLIFARYYSSDYVRTGRPASALGTNWRHTYDWILEADGNSERRIIDNEGRLITFTSADSGATWELAEPIETRYQLVNGAASEYILGDPRDQLLYTFTVAPGQILQAPRGRLKSIGDSFGNQLSLSYEDNLLTEVADGQGRSLNLAYADKLLSTVTDDLGRVVAFTHGGSNGRELLTSTDAMLAVTTYSYDGENALPGLLAGYQRPMGNTPRTQTYSASTGLVATQSALGNLSTFAFAGAETTVTDPAGKKLKHTHSTSGELTGILNRSGDQQTRTMAATSRRIASIADSLGGASGISYHADSGKPAVITQVDGTTTQFTYSARAVGSLVHYDRTMVIYADGTFEKFAYDAVGNMISREDRAGNTTTYGYNARGQVLTTTNPEGAVTTRSYNADGTVASVKDAFDNVTLYGYDTKRRLSLETFADGSTRSYTYDDNDRLISTTDPRGNTTSYTYDTNGNLATQTDRQGNVTTYSYDALDRLVREEDTSVAGKPATLLAYDTVERLSQLTDRNGNTTQFVFDGEGHLTRTIDALNNNWDNTFDKTGMPLSVRTPPGEVRAVVTDAMGRITQGTTPRGNKTQKNYDAMGRLTDTTDPLGNTVSLAYDPRGLLASWTLPGAIEASYARNTLGQITRLTDPRGNNWDRTYVKGRMSAREDPLGQITSFTYDKRNRVSVMTFPGALGTLTFTYNGNGSIMRRQYSGGGPDLSYTYDKMERLLTTAGVALTRDLLGRITTSNGIDIEYDDGGRISSVDLDTAGNTRMVTYEYDANNRLTSVTDWLGGVTSFSYDTAGRLLSESRPNGVTSTYSYDVDGRLASIAEKNGPLTLSSHALTRDAAGQVSTGLRDVITGPSLIFETQNWAFDSAGQIQSFSYDAMGRLIDDNSGTTRNWDLASRMLGSDNGTSVTYTYDGLGQRLSKTVGAEPARAYVWNQALGLPSVAIEKSGGSELRYYIHTPGGQLLYGIDAQDDSRHFNHYDELGNTMFVTGDDGAVEASYFYDPYGRRLGQSGARENPFTWQGRWGVFDDGGGQFYVRARYYDATTQRFISRDPVFSLDPQKSDRYQYAAGNPLISNDPTGLEPEPFETTHTALEGANRSAAVAQGILAVVDMATNASPSKLLGGVLATAGAALGLVDDDTAAVAGDVVTVVGAAEVVGTGYATGTAAAGAGSVGAAGAGPVAALVVTTIWSVSKVIELGIETYGYLGDLAKVEDAENVEAKTLLHLKEVRRKKREEQAARVRSTAQAHADNTAINAGTRRGSSRKTIGGIMQRSRFRGIASIYGLEPGQDNRGDSNCSGYSCGTSGEYDYSSPYGASTGAWGSPPEPAPPRLHLTDWP